MKNLLHRNIILPQPPQRIISLVPSQTELLFELGLNKEVAGITKFCIHPADKVTGKVKVGGTKDFDIEHIKRLNPDLILGNKEENDRERIESLQRSFPVWISDIVTPDDALAMIREIGKMVGKTNEADRIIANIVDSFAQLPPVSEPLLSAAYLIWRKPYMVAASDTFIDSMLQKAGFSNVFSHLSRYPELTPAQLRAAQPHCIFLSSEPYPFKAKHLAEFQALCPDAEVRLVDGELFSWYGSRLQQSAAYFSELRKTIYR